RSGGAGKIFAESADRPPADPHGRGKLGAFPGAGSAPEERTSGRARLAGSPRGPDRTRPLAGIDRGDGASPSGTGRVGGPARSGTSCPRGSRADRARRSQGRRRSRGRAVATRRVGESRTRSRGAGR